MAKHGGKIKYCPQWNRWLIWDGKRWRPDTRGLICQLAKDTVREMYKKASKIDNESVRKNLSKWAVRSEDEKKLKSLVSLARTEKGVPIEPKELDANLWLLNCQNGTIDLRTGKLRPPSPNDLITKIIPVEYDPDAECPT